MINFHRNTKYRATPALREILQETRLHASDFIYPIFLIPGKNKKKAIPSMPDIFQFSINNLLKEIEQVYAKGIKAFLLFGVPDKKKLEISFNEKEFVFKGIQKIKKTFPDIVLITDICLCSYTDNGHCGVFTKKKEKLDNDKSINILAKIAIAHAKAGADIVAPSAMQDGQVFAIRDALDKNEQKNKLILSYAAKFASSFYGPFRDAADCAPQAGDRKAYQLPFTNSKETLLKVQADFREGADMLMVKPALAYLDIIAKVKEQFPTPLAAYNVSGEYAMLKNIQAKNKDQGNIMIFESLTAIKRAGADLIISYHARDIDEILK